MKTTLTISIRRATFCCLLLFLLFTNDVQALVTGGPCKSNTDCLHGGFCDHSLEHVSYESVCICTQGYTGPYCETPKVASAKDCVVDSDCQNGGTCNLLLDDETPSSETDWNFISTNGRGICNCPPDHYGYHCQERCPCMHGGTCKTLFETGSFECQCPEEYYDRLCTTRWDGDVDETRGEASTNNAEPVLISIVGMSFAIFFCLICIASSSRGVNDNNEDGANNDTGNPGVERRADGTIVYRNGEGDEQDDEAPKDPSLVTMEDTEPDLTDLELT